MSAPLANIIGLLKTHRYAVLAGTMLSALALPQWTTASDTARAGAIASGEGTIILAQQETPEQRRLREAGDRLVEARTHRRRVVDGIRRLDGCGAQIRTQRRGQRIGAAHRRVCGCRCEQDAHDGKRERTSAQRKHGHEA